MTQLLSTFPALTQLSDRDRDWLVAAGQIDHLAPGQTLIAEGQALDALYISLSGSLAVSISKAGNQTENIGQVPPGQILGEVSFVTSLVPIATLIAAEPSEVLVITHADLKQHLRQDAAFASNFYRLMSRSLSQRVRQNTELVASSKLVPVPPLRKVLLMFAIFEDADLHWMLSQGQRQKLSPDSVLIAEGQPNDALYILLDGLLAVSVKLPNQPQPKVLASLESGEILGEISFVETGIASATVSCLEPSIVFSLPRDVLADHIAADTGFAARFYEAIAIVLGDRLQDRLLQRGYGLVAYEEGQSLEEDIEYADELDMDTLEQTAIAGSRFDWFLKQAKSVR